MKIDAKRRGNMPQVQAPRRFTAADGKITGWRVQLPGGRPLATPAVAEGRVYLGGGFGSYEFYALDADSGHVVWQYQTEDDGPTAAVVQDGYVVFNTESCELEVLTVEGRSVWKHWLGDPLMSMPAVDQGRVYMAYPDSRAGGQHYLACFDLETGKQYWRQPIPGEIITAPVIAEGYVYLTTLDGTMFCFEQLEGQPVWSERNHATSSPVVVNAQCYFSQRKEVPLQTAARGVARQTEHCAGRRADQDGTTRVFSGTSRSADYLDLAKRRKGSAWFAAYADFDAGVGFAFHKGHAKMEQAMDHLGKGHVAEIWAYQGSKPFFSKGCLYSAMGDTLNCVDVDDPENVRWTKRLTGDQPQQELLDSVITPPAVVNDKLFVGTTFGEVYCLSAQSGDALWRAGVGEPVVFQPAVALGRVYVPTQAGSLFCLETGDSEDDGWYMWGANGAHNGLPDEVRSLEPMAV